MVKTQNLATSTNHLLSGSNFTAGPRASKYTCFIAASADTLFNTSYCTQHHRLSFHIGTLADLSCQTVFTGRMPWSGKLPVLNLLTGQKSGFLPCRGDSLHRFVKLGRADGHVGQLGSAKFHLNRHRGWECCPENIKNFHFLVKSRPAEATPLTISKIFRSFYTPNYPTLVFQISCDSHHRLRSYYWETARR